jgi:ABC-type transport system substrate-binding protein
VGYPGQPWNVAIIDDPYFNETFTNKAVTTVNEVERNKLLKEINVWFISQAAYVILPTGYTYAYAYPWVKNWYGELNFGVRNGGLVDAHIWLDLALRKQMTGR